MIQNRYHKLLLLIQAVLLFFLVNYLSYHNIFTHDEGFGFLHALNKEIDNIILLSWKDANNHPLNTWSMYIAKYFFGSSEYALRLPNTIAFLIYLTSSIVIVLKIKSKKLSYACFLLLTTNPLIIQFFTQARGYGIGTGLEVCALAFGLTAFMTENSIKKLLYSQVAIAIAMLAVFANYTFLHFYFALSLTILLIYIHELIQTFNLKPKIFKKKLAYFLSLIVVFITTSVCLIVFVGREVFYLAKLKKLYYGGTESFWTDTVGSLIKYSFPGYSQYFTLIEILIGILLAYVIVTFLFVILPRNIHHKRELLFLIIIFMVSCLTTSLGHYIFDFKYLLQRTAIFLIPLFIITTSFVLNNHNNSVSHLRSVLISIFIYTIIVLSLVHFALVVNKQYYTDQKSLHIREVLNIISENRDKVARPRNVRLGISWHFEPILNYYRLKNEIRWLNPLTREGIGGNYDFYYFFKHERSMLKDQQIKRIKKFKNGTILAINKKLLSE